MPSLTTDIVVLGGGPAGGAAALGLARLGYRVALVTRPRPFAALEGVSERVLAGLRSAGFDHALQAVPRPTPRSARWNGEHTKANTERLIERAALDRGIIQDLQAGGVQVIQGRVQQLRRSGHGWQVTVIGAGDVRQLQVEVLVEARGRRAPSRGHTRLRGPATVSLLQRWQGDSLPLGSAVESFADGWAWMAVGATGDRYLQLTLDTENPSLPPREQLAAFCRETLESLESAQPLLAGASPRGPVIARASTPILHHESVEQNRIRIGDAAMAVDPLSGNGIFQALSSALLAPVVINTLLNKPEQRELATDFYHQRLEHLFYRFARIGRDFYRMEQRWQEQPFWAARSAWPDERPAHAPSDHKRPLRIEQRPVICDGYIEIRPVVITAEHPLGVWQVAGIAIAPLVESLRRKPLSTDNLAEQLRRDWPMTADQAQQLSGWLRYHGLV